MTTPIPVYRHQISLPPRPTPKYIVSTFRCGSGTYVRVKVNMGQYAFQTHERIDHEEDFPSIVSRCIEMLQSYIQQKRWSRW